MTANRDDADRPTGRIPFDVGYSIPDGGRAVADAPDEMRGAVAWLEDQVAAVEDVEERARLLAQAGGFAAILRDLDRAEEFLGLAIGLADTAGAERPRLVARIRLADVVALRGDPHDAVERLDGLLDHHAAACERQGLLDFVHQHLGKALLEVGDVDRAIGHLEQARALREAKGDAELLASTLATLDAARRST